MPWKRSKATVSQDFDPTVLVTYKYSLGKFQIYIQECWGITSRGWWGGKELWFTSEFIHPLFNKYFEAVYRNLEQKEEQNQEDENLPNFCWHCGSMELKSCPGYAGEQVLYCGECSNVLWEEDPMRYIL